MFYHLYNVLKVSKCGKFEIETRAEVIRVVTLINDEKWI